MVDISIQPKPPTVEQSVQFHQSAVELSNGRTLQVSTIDGGSASAIRDILKGKKLLTREKADVLLEASAQSRLEKWGFTPLQANFAATLIVAHENIEGYITGNESERKKGLKYQTPDKAKIIGAEAYVEVNKILQLCQNESFFSTSKGRGREIARSLGEFCANPKFYITVSESCIGGNDATHPRTFNPLLAGPSTALGYLLVDSANGEITEKSLKHCFDAYGKDWVDSAVQSLYKVPAGKNRKTIAGAYEQFYAANNLGICPNLEATIFTPKLRKLCDLYDKRPVAAGQVQGAPGMTPEEAASVAYADLKARRLEYLATYLPGFDANKDMSSEDAATLIDNFLNAEFEAYLYGHTTLENDGSKTVDIGHIKIMVNAAQSDSITLDKISGL
ncbi:MAG: hypothetical protein LBJ94_01515 [Puniceicoccales bacterium]|jgi:hypothetical protein|nr:hypothetical protein [Puniceicoccales bacterium]